MYKQIIVQKSASDIRCMCVKLPKKQSQRASNRVREGKAPGLGIKLNKSCPGEKMDRP